MVIEIKKQIDELIKEVKLILDDTIGVGLARSDYLKQELKKLINK